MKILYISRMFITDSDFPLVKEFINQGQDIDYYFFVGGKSGGIIELNKEPKGAWVKKASSFTELSQSYGDYIDLNKVNLVRLKGGKIGYLINLFIVVYLFVKWTLKRYDVVHFAYYNSEPWTSLFYRLKTKFVVTVHDPIPHSSKTSGEKIRRDLFTKADRLVLLNEVQVDDFSNNYGIDRSRIFINKMGVFDYLNIIPGSPRQMENDYVLYFGQIQSHKGIEYLCEAMIYVHDVIPSLHLIIAGRGDLYFDFQPYKKMNYIHLFQKYIGMRELVGLFKNCSFCICPYKDATQSGVVQTAFSMKVPIVGTNVGALPQTIRDHERGLIVSPCNSRELANAIIELYQNRELLQSFKDNISNDWEKTMSWEPIAQKYISIYQSALHS